VSFYSRDIIRRVRQQEENPTAGQPVPATQLAAIPPEARMDDATITVWNGEGWVDYEQWRRSRQVVRQDRPAECGSAIPAEAACVAGACGDRRIWLVKLGERCLMFVDSRKAGGRRKDFATLFLAHAIRTAETWYGAPRDGWRAENRDEKGIHEAASVPPQDPDHAQAARE
jgi:hypothetical protein